MHQPFRLDSIISECKNGSKNAFRDVVEHFQRYVYTVSFGMLNNREDAMEVTQECFIRVWRNIKEYNSKVKFTTWLYKITVNLCYDSLRVRQRTGKMFLQNYDEYSYAGLSKSPDEELICNELSETILRLAGELPLKQRAVFMLRDIQDLNIEETAKVLNISAASVKTNLIYARRSLKEKLKSIYKGDLKDDL